MNELDRLTDRFERTWASQLSDDVQRPPIMGEESVTETPTYDEISIEITGDVMANVECNLFRQLYRDAGATVEQDGDGYAAVEAAREKLSSADYGGGGTRLVAHPETLHRLHEERPALWQSEPGRLGDLGTLLSPDVPVDEAVLVDSAALIENPFADIVSTIASATGDTPYLSVRVPWTVRDERGIVSVDLEGLYDAE